MKLAGLIGFFKLSPLGETILKQAISKGGWFEAIVVEEGERGLLVRFLDEPEPAKPQAYLVLFLKWEHIATAQFIYEV